MLPQFISLVSGLNEMACYNAEVVWEYDEDSRCRSRSTYIGAPAQQHDNLFKPYGEDNIDARIANLESPMTGYFELLVHMTNLPTEP